jgi:hypothetical protein
VHPEAGGLCKSQLLAAASIQHKLQVSDGSDEVQLGDSFTS